MAWLYVVYFCAAVLSTGNLIARALSRPGERTDGHVTVSFATGVYAFFLVMFVAGVAGWLTTATFFLVPAAMIALGMPRALRDLEAWNARRHVGGFLWRFTPGELVAASLGVVALAIVLVPTLIPANTAYDARWYHLPLAEHYVAEGQIRRSPE